MLKDVRADVDKLDNAAKKISGGFGAALGVAGVALAASQIGEAIGAAVQSADRLNKLRSSFDDLAEGAGQSSDRMLAAMRLAANGMIADSDLILSANKAMMLGVADSADELVSLLNVARARGQAMGLDVTQAFNDIVTGLGRESALILDNLGITVDTTTVMNDYARSLGVTADQLDAAQRKQALLNEVMRQSRSMTPSLPTGPGAAAAQAQVAQQQLQETAGEFFSRPSREWAQLQTDAINTLMGRFTQFGAAVREVNDAVADAESGVSNMTKEYADRLKAWATGMNEVTQAAAAGLPEAEAYLDTLANMSLRGLSEGFTDQDINIMRLATSSIREAAEEKEKAGQAAQRAAAHYIEEATAQQQAARAAYEATDAYKENVRQHQELVTAAWRASAEMQKIASQFGVVGQMALQSASDIDTFNNAVNRIQAGFGAADRLQAMRQSAIAAANAAAQQAVDAGGDPQAIAEMLGQVTDQIWNMAGPTSQTTESMFLFQQQLNANSDGLNDYTAQLKAADSASQKYAAQGLSDMQRAYGALEDKIAGIRSKVASLIQQSLTLDVSWPGKDGAEGERRGDAINENARRLAAIANEGLNGQSWLEEFAQEAPGTYADLMLKIAEGMDARGAAQYLLGEFQAGLRPDLLDFSQIKEKVKQSLLGDMRISAMTDQLTQELVAELGVSAQQVQKALGEVTGGELGNGSGVNVGPVAVDGLSEALGQIDSLRAQLSGLAGTINAGPVSVGGIDAALGQVDSLRGQLAGLAGTISAGPVSVGGIDAALGQIDSLRAQLAGLSGTINAGPVAVGGIDAALGQIDSLRAQLSGLAGAVTIGPVTVAGLDAALAQIDGLRSRLAELTGGQAEADAATQGVGAGEVLVPVRLSGDLQAELDGALAALRVNLVSLPLHVSGDLQGEIDAMLSAVRGGAVAVPAHLTGDLQDELDTAVAALRGGEIAVTVRAESSVQADVDGALAALAIGGVSVPVSLSGDLQAELSAAVAAVRVDGLAIPVSIVGDLQTQIESAAQGVTPTPLVVPLQLADDLQSRISSLAESITVPSLTFSFDVSDDLQSRINAAVQAVAAGVVTVAVRLDGDLQGQIDATLQAVTITGVSIPVRLSENLQADIDATMEAVTSTSISVPVRLDGDLQAQIDAAAGMLTGGISVPVRLTENLQAELSAATEAVTAPPLAVPVALSGDLQGQTAAAVQSVTVSGLTVSVTLGESLQADVDTAVSALALPTLSLPLRVAGDLAAQTAAAAQAVSVGEITVPAHIGSDLQSELDAAVAALQVAAVLVSVRLAGDLQAEVNAALGAVTVESVAVPVSLSGNLQGQLDALAGGVTAPTITAPVALSGDLAAELSAATRAVSASEVLVPVRLAGDLRAELDAAMQSARVAALVSVRIEGDLQAQLDAAASAANAPTITAALQLSGDLQEELERALRSVSVPPLAVPVQLSDSLPAELAAGFAAATDGEQMVRGMVERMEASYSRLYQSGVKAGSQWGAGFMSAAETGVALPLVQLLATLVTPAVLAALAGRSSRMGAQ